MEYISIWAAFSTGLFSFVSPCVLPLVPVYLASLAGPEIFEAKANRSRLPIFLHSLSFVIGFSIIFTTLGAVAGLAGFALASHLLITRIAGSLLIVFGLFVLATLKFPWLNYEKRLTPSLGTATSYLRSFFIGVIFSLAWSPCIAGLLMGTLGLALSSEAPLRGAYLLGTYSLGLGLPFLIMGLAFDSIGPLLKRIRRYSTSIHIVGGLALIALGALILTDRLVWF